MWSIQCFAGFFGLFHSLIFIFLWLVYLLILLHPAEWLPLPPGSDICHLHVPSVLSVTAQIPQCLCSWWGGTVPGEQLRKLTNSQMCFSLQPAGPRGLWKHFPMLEFIIPAQTIHILYVYFDSSLESPSLVTGACTVWLLDVLGRASFSAMWSWQDEPNHTVNWGSTDSIYVY